MRSIALSFLAFSAIPFAQSAIAASDPFVGKWKLDVSRSTIVDDIKVEALGANKFVFSFEGGPRETILADGSDQPGLPGTTLSVKADDPHTLTVVRKQSGKTIVSAHWKLAPDAQTLRDSFTSLQPDGSNVTVEYLYKRMAGTTGFAGVWESTTKPIGLKLELGIEPYEGNGLSFITSGSRKNVIFDGRDHAVAGAKDGSTVSGRRRGSRAIAFTQKSGRKVQAQRHLEVTRDGGTLTEVLRMAGQATPDVLVFARE